MSNEQSASKTIHMLRITVRPKIMSEAYFTREILKNRVVLSAKSSFGYLGRFSQPNEETFIDGVMLVDNEVESYPMNLGVNCSGEITFTRILPNDDDCKPQPPIQVPIIELFVLVMLNFVKRFYRSDIIKNGVVFNVEVTDALGRCFASHVCCHLRHMYPYYNSKVILSESISAGIVLTPEDWSKNVVDLYVFVMRNFFSRSMVNVANDDLRRDILKLLKDDALLPLGKIVALVDLPVEQVQKLVQPQKEA